MMATYPHFTRTEIARRLKCSRRSIINWAKSAEFVGEVQELQRTIKPDVRSLIAAMTKTDRAELHRKLREERGLNFPEIQEIEQLLLDRSTDQVRDFDLASDVVSRLQGIMSKDVEVVSVAEQRRWVEELESELDRELSGWRQQLPGAGGGPGPEVEGVGEDEDPDSGDEELDDALEDQRPRRCEYPGSEGEDGED